MKVPTRISAGVLPSKLGLRGPSGEGGTPTAFGAELGNAVTGLAANVMALGKYVQEQETQKRRFSTLRAFSAFQVQTKKNLEDQMRNSTPGDTSFYPAAGEAFKEQEKQFLDQQVPPDMRDEFSARTAELGAGLALDSIKFQYEQNDTYFKQGIQDALDGARIEVGQNPSPENLAKQRTNLDEVINSSGLSNAEKTAVRRQVYAGVESVAYRQVQLQRLRDEQSGIGTDLDQAAQIISDVTGATEEEAAAKAQQAMSVAFDAVGDVDRWASLPSRVRAALISVAAEQGGLPEDVAKAVQAGDMEALSEAVVKLGHGDIITNPEASIDDNEAFANVPYEDRLSLTADAQRQVAAEATANKQAETAAKAEFVNALKVAVYDGDAGQADVDTARAKGLLTDYEDIKAVDDMIAKRDEALRLAQMGEQMMQGNITFAPGNDDHKKILNAMVGDKGNAAIDNMDSDYAANVLIPIVKQSGMVPSDTLGLISGMVRSHDSQRMYWALDLMQQIERANPQAANAFSTDDSTSLAIWQSTRDYVSEDEMTKMLRGPVDPAERNAQIALRGEGEKVLTAKDGALVGFNAVSLFKGPGLIPFLDQAGKAPATKWVEGQLNADFHTLFLNAYQKTGNVEVAKGVAAKQILNVWGMTKTGDDAVIMKYPPEKAYPMVGESHDWMEAQLRREGLIKPDEGFQLITDTQTEAEWGQTSPSYLIVKTKDGVATPIIQEADPADPFSPGASGRPYGTPGLPVRVYFDYGAEEQNQEIEFRKQRSDFKEEQDAMTLIQHGLQHELDTGTPIPQPIIDDVMHQLSQRVDPNEMDKQGAAIAKFFGPSDQPVGFETNKYRLK